MLMLPIQLRFIPFNNDHKNMFLCRCVVGVNNSDAVVKSGLIVAVIFLVLLSESTDKNRFHYTANLEFNFSQM